MDIFIRTLIDPFNTRVSQPKLLDGRVERSAGTRFRSSGSLTLPADGTPGYIVLCPGFSNNLHRSLNVTIVGSPFYPSHVEDVPDVALVHSLRLVTTGLKLSLLNGPLESEGFFEAVRVPFKLADFDVTTPGNNQIAITAAALATYGAEMSNYESFITGSLRDIHRHLFKLNSRNVDHEFIAPTQKYDPTWDVIIIKCVGRIDAVTPTTLRYQVASCQEVVYNPGTVAARLMTRAPRVNDVEDIIQKTNFLKPSIGG
jgi:hypothetical protein